MGIPKIHWEARLSNISDSFLYKKSIIAYIDSLLVNLGNGSGLILSGPYSSGKSALGAILLKAALSQKVSGMWARPKEIIDSYITKKDSDESFWDQCKTTPLLVIDDLIAKNQADFLDVSLEELIRYRVDCKQTTIITTNVSKRGLEAKNPALFAILSGVFTWLAIDKFDFRRNVPM